MRNLLKQHIFAYIVCSALILTLGTYWETTNSNYVQAAPNPYIDHMTKSQMAALPHGLITPIVKPAISTDNTIKPQTGAKKAASAQYETTAYYLNVRANAYPQSKIINVVKKGTVLQVLSVTDNGWLRLEGGGYVHGGYAKLIAAEVKPSEPVKTLALKTSITEATVVTPARAELTVVRNTVKDAPDKPTSKVKSDSGLTEEHISEIFEGTALEGHGLEEAILEVEDEYGINAYFTIAVMKLESGNGHSRLAKKKNNLFGLNAIDGDAYNRAFSFETKGDSVRKFGALMSKNYLGKGYATVEKVASKYCPANPEWSGLVKTIMNRDFKKL